VTVTAPTLPGAQSYEYFGLNFARNQDSSTTFGTLNYGSFVDPQNPAGVGPGCGGTCTATTALGADPSTSLNLNEVSYFATSLGHAEANVAYYVEYFVPGGATTASFPVTLTANDALSIAAGDRGQAFLGFGLAPPGFALSNKSGGAFTSFSLVDDTDCVNGCPVSSLLSPAPLPAAQSLDLVENTLYLLEFWVSINPSPDGAQNSAMIDPIITTKATAGTLIFSPGVGGATPSVPEPSTWAMILIGFAGLGYAAYRRERARLAGA
jgi:hypothetical protein